MAENLAVPVLIVDAGPSDLTQWRIEAILRHRLAELGGTVEYATTLENFTQDEPGITASVSGPGDKQALRAAWLIGCDGGRSLVRRTLGLPFIGETFAAFRMLVADVRATALDRDHWHIWRNGDGFLALAPLPGSDTYQLQASIAFTGCRFIASGRCRERMR